MLEAILLRRRDTRGSLESVVLWCAPGDAAAGIGLDKGEEVSSTRERASPDPLLSAVQFWPPSVERKTPLADPRYSRLLFAGSTMTTMLTFWLTNWIALPVLLEGSFAVLRSFPFRRAISPRDEQLLGR